MAFDNIPQTPLSASIMQALGAALLTDLPFETVKPNGVDDAPAIQAALDRTGFVQLVRGLGSYKVKSSIIWPDVSVFYGNGAIIVGDIRTADVVDPTKAVFRNNPTVDSSHNVLIRDVSVRGVNQVMINSFIANSPDAGTAIIADNVQHNTMVGSRPVNTSWGTLEQIDFSTFNNCGSYNADLALSVGSAPPRRNCTQITISNFKVGQCSSGARFQGVDKSVITGLDIAKCASGYSFVSDIQRMQLFNCHVEQISQGASAAGGYAYSAVSARVPAGDNGRGFSVAPNQQFRAVVTGCTTIDAGGVTDSTAVCGWFTGECTDPAIQSVSFVDCDFSKTMGGSTNWMALLNEGTGRWKGNWGYTTEVKLWANGKHHIDFDIEDSRHPTSGNLLKGNSVLSLIDDISGAGNDGTAPTIVEIGMTNTTQFGHRLDFVTGQQKYKANIINCPYGWNTVEITAAAYGGGCELVVQRNGTGGLFTDLVRIQLNRPPQTVTSGVPSNMPRRQRIPFWNPNANDGTRVGLRNTLSATNPPDKLFVEYGSLALYRGVGQRVAPQKNVQTVLALPAISSDYVRTGHLFAVRAAGVVDTLYFAGNSSANVNAWNPV